jgi:hypothetical protein
MIGVLDEAVRAQLEVVETIREEVSARYAKQLKPEWDRHVLAMYRSAQTLSASTTRFRQFRYEIIQAGIVGNSQVLRAPNVRAPLQLGAESDFGSEISSWRRLLEQWGLLP